MSDCAWCEDTGMMLNDTWIGWHDDYGDVETEPPKYVSCIHYDTKEGQ